MPKLSAKQKLFVDEYLIDLNACAAYVRAGYKAKGSSLTTNASRMLTNADIAAQIEISMKERQNRTQITADRVLQELSRIAFFDIRKLYNSDGSLKRPDELDDDAAAVLAGIDVTEMAGGLQVDAENGGTKHVPMFTKKAKVFDKTAALTLAMRHLGMLKDKLAIQNPDGSPLIPQSGVLLVPAPVSADDWSKAAAQVSANQKAATKH